MYYSFSKASIQAKWFKKLAAVSLIVSQAACLGNFEAMLEKSRTTSNNTKQIIDQSLQTAALEPIGSANKTPELASDPFAALQQARQATKDLWQRITLGYGLGGYSGYNTSPEAKARIDAMIDWQLKHPSHLRDLCSNAKPFLYIITERMEQAHVPTELVLLPAVESAYRPYSFSAYEAAGLWQIIPGTARLLGLKKNEWYDGRRDVYAATGAAIKYLKKLNRQFDGDWLLTLAAYNSGPGTVSRAIRNNQANNLPTDFWNLQLPEETSNYIPKFLALAKIIQDPAAYNVSFCHIGNHPELERVPLTGQLDLSIAAKMAGISLSQLQHNNAGLSKWATPPAGPHYLFIDHLRAAEFSAKEQKLPKSKRMLFVRHHIKAGDTLSQIAKKYNISSSTIRKHNNMSNNKLRAGKYLLIVRDPDADLSVYRGMLDLDGNKVGAPKIYTVKNGDSWWSIAHAHKVQSSELAGWNNKNNKAIIKAGDKLKIYPSKTKKADIKQQNLQKIRYKVRRGDTLSQIAKRYQVTVKEIRAWNKRTIGKYLKPNSRIVIYVDGRKI